jgi:hypothetical protein
VPSLTRPAAAHGYRTLRFADADVSVSLPAGWSQVAEHPPLLTTLTSGDAVIALWRHPARQPPPASASALGAAGARLIQAIDARGSSARVLGWRVARIDGSPAIELTAFEQIAGQPRQVLSTHLFTRSGEAVLEEYAPPAVFRAVRAGVFARVRHSLTITGGQG